MVQFMKDTSSIAPINIINTTNVSNISNASSFFDQLSGINNSRAKRQVGSEYTKATLDGTLSGPLKADGTPDYRYKANRIQGMNMDGSRD